MPTQVTFSDLAAIQICPCCILEFAYVAMIESENGQQTWCVVIPEHTSHGYYYMAKRQPNTNMIVITGQTIICESAEHSNKVYNEQIETNSKFLDVIKLQYLS